jgi:hypothetical protein
MLHHHYHSTKTRDWEVGRGEPWNNTLRQAHNWDEHKSICSVNRSGTSDFPVFRTISVMPEDSLDFLSVFVTLMFLHIQMKQMDVNVNGREKTEGKRKTKGD